MVSRYALLVLALALALPTPGRAAVFAVGSTADAPDAVPGNGVCATAAATCTLRAAVMEANALAGDDAIDLPAGLYHLTPTVPTPTNPIAYDPASGDLDFASEGTTEIRGAGAATTIIDGAGCERVLHFLGGGLVVRDVSVAGAAGEGLQAIIDDITGSQEIYDSVFRDNGGPGIAFAEGALLVQDSVVVGNGGPGVLVYNDGDADIVRSKIRGNQDGGVVATAGSHSIVLIDRSVVHDNVSTHYAGGVSGIGEMVVTVRNSTISGNGGAKGGGVYVGANDYAGVAMALESTTVTDNYALAGGGVLVETLGIGSASLRLRNSLVAANYSADDRDCRVDLQGDMSFSYTSDGYNLIGNASGCPFPAAIGDMLGNDLLPIDPRLTALAGHGGPTATHSLRAGSPARDTGNPSTPGSVPNACPAVDQRGVGRPRDGNADGVARCDIGAVEELEECSDGIDNDRDGLVDFGEDPQCDSPRDGYEQVVACGLGGELSLLLALGVVVRRAAPASV